MAQDRSFKVGESDMQMSFRNKKSITYNRIIRYKPHIFRKGTKKMSKTQILSRMSFILAGDNLKRVSIEQRNNMNYIYVDLHGMSCKIANRVVRSIIAMYRFSFVLVLIHGFNHGTALKEMIRNSIENSRIKSITSPDYNPGITYMQLA